MNKARYSQGFTLIEIMITVAIIGIMASIAIPSYNNYIRTSQHAAAKHNAVSLAGFLDLYFYENDEYIAGTYTYGGADTLTAALEWSPAGDEVFEYVVKGGVDCGGNITECYTVTVTLISDTSITQTVSRP